VNDSNRLCGQFAVGIVSDTHGHVPSSVLEAFQGVDHVIHAGDIGSPQVLVALSELAPVTAVRGNCDFGLWAQELPESAAVELGPVLFLVAHIPTRADSLLKALRAAPRRVVVVSGHTHRPQIERQGELLFINPGTAGSSRCEWTHTVALAVVSQAGSVEARLIKVD